jgi:hypothetical protein
VSRVRRGDNKTEQDLARRCRPSTRNRRNCSRRGPDDRPVERDARILRQASEIRRQKHLNEPIP